ncbi:hypothetical protein Ancab_019291, partial [Ancistrocladus abbreviatus]
YLHGRLIHVELVKPGSKSHGGYPKTSGLPKEQHLHKHGKTREVIRRVKACILHCDLK